jgi:hypothetical protein
MRVSCPVCASHSFTVLSTPPEAMCLSSGLKHTLVTPAVCPLRVRASCPVWASQTFTVWSPLPEARRLLSAEKATLPFLPPARITS